MRRGLISLIVLAGVLQSSSPPRAQDYSSSFDVYKDIPVAGPNPCYPSSRPLPARRVVYDNSLIPVYLCEDSRTVLRRFSRPNGNAKPPIKEPPPTSTSSCPGNHVAGRLCATGHRARQQDQERLGLK